MCVTVAIGFAGLAVRAAELCRGLFDDLEYAVEAGCRLQQFEQEVALAPGQGGETLQELFELPCLHGAPVNGSGRHWTAGLRKRFHTWREQRLHSCEMVFR